VPENQLASMAMHAPPGTVERQHALALALRALAVGAPFCVFAPLKKGGARLAKELTGFGCAVVSEAKHHFRVCQLRKPGQLVGMEAALAAGNLRLRDGWWTQPGIFSWDRVDEGSALLATLLPPLAGAGADLGCGNGFLSRQVLAAPAVSVIHAVDKDRRAVSCARKNLDAARSVLHWADVTLGLTPLQQLDFVVMNPPFHAASVEDKTLGQAFIRAAATLLRPGGVCWLVANRHLPYEAVLRQHFTCLRLAGENKAFKVYEAIK